MENEIYDFDEENLFDSENNKIKDKIRHKTIIHRSIVIIAALLFIAIIASCTALAFHFFGGGSEIEPSSDKPQVSESVPESRPTKPTADSTTEPTTENVTEQTSKPESEPTSEPTEVPTEEPTSESLEPTQYIPPVVIDPTNYTVSDRADPSYFDNVVFVGDSVSDGLRLYTLGKRSDGESCLGNAQFLTSGSLSYANLLWDVSSDSVHPVYNGKKMKLEESLPKINPGKIYILLGANDIAVYGVDSSIDHAGTMLANIRSVCPEAAIIVLSTTPKYKPAEKTYTNLTNAQIDEFNQKMSARCSEWGYIWLDIASQFKLPDGTMNPDYCGDSDGMGIHFLGSAYKMWVDYLETHKIYPAS